MIELACFLCRNDMLTLAPRTFVLLGDRSSASNSPLARVASADPSGSDGVSGRSNQHCTRLFKHSTNVLLFGTAEPKPVNMKQDPAETVGGAAVGPGKNGQ